MPLLSKKVISNFLRSDCQRRLKIDLCPDTNTQLPNQQTALQERQALGLPPRVVRPGLQALSAAGENWEEAKINDLVRTLGTQALIGNAHQTSKGTWKFSDAPLLQLLLQAAPGRFLVQAQFDVGATFQSSVGVAQLASSHNLAYARLRPDLIQIFGASHSAHRQAVNADGSLTDMPAGDPRMGLRVIDIKLTAEPSVPYFIEVTFYAMALAGWLVDNGLSAKFFVLPEPTVWPGSHDAAAIVKLQTDHQARGSKASTQQVLAALEDDLEIGEFGVFAPRLRRFFQDELPSVLNAPWRSLAWHVDNRCIGCEYLGYPWPNTQSHPDHCWSTATRTDHLSQVAFVSRGARGALEDHQILTVGALAATHPTNVAYDEHHVLRATRNVVAGRAQSLATRTASVPPQVGTSAVMPNWAELRIFVTADFDIGSGITMAFGVSAVWMAKKTSVPAGQHFHRFPSQVFPVSQRSLAAEANELNSLLGAMDGFLQHAVGVKNDATIQVYVWDTLTYEHLVRVIGRHLSTFIQNNTLRRLAWLFPPEDLVPNASISDRKCPITVVRDAIRAVVAAPVPHYYSLLNVAREYHSAHTQAPFNLFQVPAMFEDPLSDQIPSERAHEIWSTNAGASRHWFQQMQQLDRTVKVRLSAIESIAERLRGDLRGRLNTTAPRIADLKPPTLPRKMADDARLWFIFSELSVALDRLDVQAVHAMPPYEREARFRSAMLVRRLDAAAAGPVLRLFAIAPASGVVVYELNHRSSEVKVREGDFTFAVAPVAQPGFLARRLRTVAGPAFRLPPNLAQREFLPMERVTQVKVLGIDRDRGYIVVEFDRDWWHVIQSLESCGAMDLSQDAILDPIHRDFFLDKLKATLNSFANPPQAVARAIPEVARAIGSKAKSRKASSGAPKPATEVLWNADGMAHTNVSRQLAQVRLLLEQNGFHLNASQWVAWEEALTHRCRLIWGPPGTGKSRTLRTIALGCIHEAVQASTPCRVLIAGPTYEASDNVLLGVHAALAGQTALAVPTVQVARLRSTARPFDATLPAGIDVATSSAELSGLRHRLQQNAGLTVVSGTPQQVHKLCVAAGGASASLFDLIIVDEASQMDVASSTLVLGSLATGGSVIVAGDKRQLPPIHQAEPPAKLEHIVGPILTYLEERFGIQPCVLETNYRSCRSIVELAHVADYPRTLHAHSPDLRIDYTAPVPATVAPPANWPQNLFWTPEWSSMLDADQQAVCFIYREGRSSQWNQFEADAIASLVWLLHGRLGDQLHNERAANGAAIPASGQPYPPQDFWAKGVGIVTPHRAQQALIVSRLQSIFQSQGTQGIREAVDTVERFQGQQRDVMLATFALGDPDAISDEDEFLLSLNRFNVMASRARAKLIVVVSQEVVDHLSSDMDVLKGSALLKTFAETFCSQGRSMQLGHLPGGTPQAVDGTFRWRP